MGKRSHHCSFDTGLGPVHYLQGCCKWDTLILAWNWNVISCGLQSYIVIAFCLILGFLFTDKLLALEGPLLPSFAHGAQLTPGMSGWMMSLGYCVEHYFLHKCPCVWFESCWTPCFKYWKESYFQNVPCICSVSEYSSGTWSPQCHSALGLFPTPFFSPRAWKADSSPPCWSPPQGLRWPYTGVTA